MEVEGAPPAEPLSLRSSHRMAKPVKQARASRAEGYETRAFLPRPLLAAGVPRCGTDMGPLLGCWAAYQPSCSYFCCSWPQLLGKLGGGGGCYCCWVLSSRCLPDPASSILQFFSLAYNC